VTGGGPREVIFEIRRIGDIQRVAAVDAESGVEVVIQAPASAARAEVELIALRKLERALAQSESAPAPRRPGKHV
jgi:hypothetical protein